MKTIRETIISVLKNDLSNATDHRKRAEIQQKRMPFDHDNNSALERYKQWETDTSRALLYITVHPEIL